MKAEGVAPGPGPAARIVVIVPYAEAVTGGVLADLTLARELTSLGRDVDVVAFLRHPQPRSVRYALDHLTFSLRLIGRFHGEPERHLYLEDQALSNVILPFNWYARWWRRERVALLTHHLGYSLRHPLRRVLRRWIDGVVARRADLLLAPSESTRGELVALGARHEDVRVIPMGITQRAPPQGRRSPPEGGVVRLLTVGTVERRKGLPSLIAALATLRDCSWVLDVVGAPQPQHLQELQALVRTAGLVDRVHFHGRVADEELSQLLAAADMYVSPSRWEGFGLAVVEAMAAGLPVVAVAAGAVTELIDSGRTGVLVPPGDIPALGRALRDLMGDEDARSALGRAAEAEARARFSWQKTARSLDDALSALDNRPEGIRGGHP